MTRTSFAVLLLGFTGFTAFSQTHSRLADYAVILEDPPLAQKSRSRADLFSARVEPQLQRIRAAQRGVLDELSRRKVPVSGASQHLLNAVFVHTDRETAAQLRSIPGVAHVVYAPPLKPDLNTAADLVNASSAWSAVGGAANAGAGVKIGIIDSGIDQNHPGLKDPTLTPPAGYPLGDTAFTNKKVIVARSFLGQLGYADPDSRNYVPDDITPRDHSGHGTAIAMIAAGAANDAPLGGSTVTIQGIAPKAFLGNYKVQGSPGANTYARVPGVIAALTAALQDHMDIVTLAYGEGDATINGPLDVDPGCSSNPQNYCDPIAQAVENAITNGLVVITSAGNDGNLGPNTIHSPGTAPSAITVGSSTNSHLLLQMVHAVSPAPPSSIQNIYALFGDGPQVQAALAAPIKDVAQLGNDGLACSALPAGSLSGAIALIQRGTCDYSTKIGMAQNAGAVAVVIYQSAGNETPYSSWGASDTGIPGIMVGCRDGLQLKNWVDANSSAVVSLDPAFSAATATPNSVSAFSSRGPAIGTNGIKPEIVAPGEAIYTATQTYDPNSPMYSATGYIGVSGTSMAVGMAAGVAAMVRQKHPDTTTLSPARIKSAVVNSATWLGGSRVTDRGAGVLNAPAAIGVVTTFEPATLSFGPVTAGSLPVSLTLNITNVTNALENISLSPSGDADSKATLEITPSSFPLGAGQTTSVVVKLQGAQPNYGSYQGSIQVAVNSAVMYNVPYLYISTDGVFDSAMVTYGDFVGATEDTNWLIALRALDKYGLPVTNVPVLWQAVSGGGSVSLADPATAKNGVAAALVDLGAGIGDNVFTATVGGKTVTFHGYARGYQTVPDGGIVDAATYQSLSAPKGYAPGSFISIFGSYLAPAAQAFSTCYLPYALSNTSVGFYTADGKRYAGRLAYVSPNQLNVQIPWEMQGQTSAQMVIRIGDEPSAAYSVPISQFSPGAFQYYDYSNGAMYATALQMDSDSAPLYWVSRFSPAQRGGKLRLYVNGLGAVNNQPATGEVTGAGVVTITTPTVAIGGKTAALVRQAGAGMTQGWIGSYEIDVQVPADIPAGTAQMTISIGGVTSAAVALPVQ